MLRGKRIMAILSTTLLFSTSGLPSTPFHALATEVVKDNINKEMVLETNKLGLIENPFITKTKKLKLENDKKKTEEERLKNQKELEEQKKSIKESHEQTFILTYYGLLESECGKIDGITASGKRITDGMIASPPQLKFGTKIIIEGKEYVVEDRGSSKYIKINNDGSIRIDVYLPKLNNETDKDYLNRIENKGVKRVQGYIIK